MAWDDLLAILRERRTEFQRTRTEPPTACPNDGEPLQVSPRGGLFCPFDGWRWPRDAATL